MTATATLETSPKRKRLDGIDALRGLVMIFMCLDHTREFFGDLRLNPENLETTTPFFFLTRWITHFCAPTFIFLAGISAWMYGQKVRDKTRLSKFLLSRGIWLIFLEFTVVYFGWLQEVGEVPFMFIVIAAIGASMIALAGLIWLPFPALVTFALVVICGHNLLDPIEPHHLGMFAPVWVLLHEGGSFANLPVDIGYPILAWIGVISVGYCFGAILQQDRSKRRKACLQIGFSCTVLFVVLRAINGYGDPNPRELSHGFPVAVMSFLKCTKYPPSLLYLLMTLGPALIVLGLLDRESQDSPQRFSLYRVLLTYGRVPLFFYVVHLYLIHTTSRLLYWVVRSEPISPLSTSFKCFIYEKPFPEIYGFDLWVVYVAWPIMLLILLPLCTWFGRIKRNGKSAVWSYL